MIYKIKYSPIYFSYESEMVFENVMFTLNLHLCLQLINFQSSTIYNRKQSITILNKYSIGGDSSPKNENYVIKLLTLMLLQTCKTSFKSFLTPHRQQHN